MTPPFRTERCRFLVENLNLPAATGVDDARWEHFQLAYLNDPGTFRIDNKSRQIAFSFISAAGAVADAVLDGESTVFVSINLDEAKEKIRYSRAVFENLEIGGLARPRQPDNQLMIEFDNGARLISHASKAPRGKARMNVVLDEFAHVQHDRQIYTGALPVISKGGRLRMGSSPMGASGVFWEVFTEAMQKYPGYTRKSTPWWEARAFCTNVREARRLAPSMETFARVELFGNDRIKAIFANVPLEDFQQEYEAMFVDEVTAWISWEEIKANQLKGEGLECALATARGKDVTAAFEAIERIQRAIHEGRVEKALAAGMDVGRTRNASELYFVGLSTTNDMPLRLALTLDNVDFDDQLAVIVKALSSLPVTKLLIDQNGIGRNLAESAAKKFPVKAEGVDFTNGTKQVWATDLKTLMQQRRVPLPSDRDVAYQIHSVKRRVTAAKNLVFDTERNEKHHADKFWALALACNGAAHPAIELTFY